MLLYIISKEAGRKQLTIMARNLTTSEKKDLKVWAKANGIDLSYNKALDFGNAFWGNDNIQSLKAALMSLESESELKLKARNAVGSNYVAYDCVSVLGNDGLFELIGYEGKEVMVIKSSIVYVNGYLAIPYKLLA